MTREARMRKAMVRQKSLKSIPAMPPARPRGRNTATVVRVQAMTAVVFVTGLSGVSVNIGQIQLKGMVLACIVGMLMGILFYIFDRLHWTNDVEAEPAGKKAK